MASAGSFSNRSRARRRFMASAISRCCAPSWRSRSMRRRWASPACTIRARDARSSSSLTRSSASSARKPGGRRCATRWQKPRGSPAREAYWVPEISAYVESEGRPVALPAPGNGRFAPRISHGGEPVAAVIHDAALEDDATSCGRSAPRPRSPSNERWTPSCRPASRSCAPRARGSCRPGTSSAAASSATCTTARSSG